MGFSKYFKVLAFEKSRLPFIMNFIKMHLGILWYKDNLKIIFNLAERIIFLFLQKLLNCLKLIAFIFKIGDQPGQFFIKFIRSFRIRSYMSQKNKSVQSRGGSFFMINNRLIDSFTIAKIFHIRCCIIGITKSTRSIIDQF